MSDSIITLDVREDLRQGREPFSKIMQACADLKDEEKLLIIAPFNPSPLLAVMAQRGFRHAAKPRPGGDWEVLFARGTEPVCSDENADSSQSPPRAGVKIIKIDARGLEPPQPLVVILEAVESLPTKMTSSSSTTTVGDGDSASDTEATADEPEASVKDDPDTESATGILLFDAKAGLDPTDDAATDKELAANGADTADTEPTVFFSFCTISDSTRSMHSTRDWGCSGVETPSFTKSRCGKSANSFLTFAVFRLTALR